MPSSYVGPERRRHRIFVTKNTEYHCRDTVCVAVRDRRTGRFLDVHPALGRTMTAGIRFGPEGSIDAVSSPMPNIGENLCFTGRDRERADVLTSPLVAIERPPKEVVRTYKLAS